MKIGILRKTPAIAAAEHIDDHRIEVRDALGQLPLEVSFSVRLVSVSDTNGT